MLIVRDRRHPGPRSLVSGPPGVNKPFPLIWGASRHYCGRARVTLTCVIAHVTSYRYRNGSETVSLAAWPTQPGRAGSHGAQAASHPPSTESPPSAYSLHAHPQPSPTSAGEGPWCTLEVFIFRPQQIPLCLPGSSFQLPGLKKFLPKMENWAEAFPLGTA